MTTAIDKTTTIVAVVMLMVDKDIHHHIRVKDTIKVVDGKTATGDVSGALSCRMGRQEYMVQI